MCKKTDTHFTTHVRQDKNKITTIDFAVKQSLSLCLILQQNYQKATSGRIILVRLLLGVASYWVVPYPMYSILPPTMMGRGTVNDVSVMQGEFLDEFHISSSSERMNDLVVVCQLNDRVVAVAFRLCAVRVDTDFRLRIVS